MALTDKQTEVEPTSQNEKTVPLFLPSPSPEVSEENDGRKLRSYFKIYYLSLQSVEQHVMDVTQSPLQKLRSMLPLLTTCKRLLILHTRRKRKGP